MHKKARSRAFPVRGATASTTTYFSIVSNLVRWSTWYGWPFADKVPVEWKIIVEADRMNLATVRYHYEC